MAKKCIPGVFCIENMTLAVFMFLFILLAYLYYVFIVKVNKQTDNKQPEKIIVYQPQIPIRSAPNVILDCINNGDMVYVEGYNDTFKVTVYENSRFNYIPYI